MLKPRHDARSMQHQHGRVERAEDLHAAPAHARVHALHSVDERRGVLSDAVAVERVQEQQRSPRDFPILVIHHPNGRVR
eukprot:796787-Prymnesium_polylepis.1